MRDTEISVACGVDEPLAAAHTEQEHRPVHKTPSPDLCLQPGPVVDADHPAVVALARKLAVIMHAIWKDGTEFKLKGRAI